MYKRLLVAVDDSEQSYKVLDHAIAIAEKFGSELTLLAVFPKIAIFSHPDDHGASLINYKYLEQSHEKLKAIYQQALTHAKAKIRSEHPDLNVSTILREGRPSHIIVNEAKKDGCDLVIMESREIEGIYGWILGSASRRVIDSCKKPVLIIKVESLS